MVNEFEIEISRADVYRECNLVSAYLGTKEAADGVSFANIALQDEDKEIVDTYFANALTTISAVLEHYIGEITEDTGKTKVCFTLTMPGNWNSNLLYGLNRVLVSYIANVIVTNWLRILKHISEDRFIAQTNSIIFDMKTIIYSRKRPEKPSVVLKEEVEGV